MKIRLLFALALAAFTFSNIHAQTLEDIINKHVEALGGAEKLKTVTTVTSESSVAVQGMEIPSKRYLIVGKSMRSETSIMGNSMVQVVNGATGWKIMPAMMGGSGEPEDMTGDELKAMADQLDPFGGLYNYETKGHKIELIGKEKVDKKEVFHLKIVTNMGITIHQYLDASTYLPYKVTSEANGQQVEMIMSNYEAVDGIKFANTIDLTTSMGAFTMITNKTVLNAPIDEKIFAKPGK